MSPVVVVPPVPSQTARPKLHRPMTGHCRTAVGLLSAASSRRPREPLRQGATDTHTGLGALPERCSTHSTSLDVSGRPPPRVLCVVGTFITFSRRVGAAEHEPTAARRQRPTVMGRWNFGRKGSCFGGARSSHVKRGTLRTRRVHVPIALGVSRCVTVCHGVSRCVMVCHGVPPIAPAPLREPHPPSRSRATYGRPSVAVVTRGDPSVGWCCHGVSWCVMVCQERGFDPSSIVRATHHHPHHLDTLTHRPTSNLREPVGAPAERPRRGAALHVRRGDRAHVARDVHDAPGGGGQQQQAVGGRHTIRRRAPQPSPPHKWWWASEGEGEALAHTETDDVTSSCNRRARGSRRGARDTRRLGNAAAKLGREVEHRAVRTTVTLSCEATRRSLIA